MSRKLRKSFVGLPGAKFFRPVLRDRVFQHPRLIAKPLILLDRKFGFADLSATRSTESRLLRSVILDPVFASEVHY